MDENENFDYAGNCSWDPCAHWVSVRWLCYEMGVTWLLSNIAKTKMLTIASVGFGMKMRILTMLGMAVGSWDIDYVWVVGW